MAIAPRCDVVTCGRELEEFGALLLSPPDNQGFVKKYHLCVDCYATLQRERLDAVRSTVNDPHKPESA
jgi:hypothetical protein